MKATGITRRVDELGRIVVPKELRTTLQIKEGTMLEIFTNSDEELIFKKYCHLSKLNLLARSIAISLNNETNLTVLIKDSEHFITSSGKEEKNLINKIDKDYKFFKSNVQKNIEIQDNLFFYERIVQNILVTPIIFNGDIIGHIIMINFDKEFSFNDNHFAVCRVASSILQNQYS